LNLALRLFAESMLVLVALYVFYTLWEPSFGVTLSLLMTFSIERELAAIVKVATVFTDDIFNGYSIFVTHSSGFEGWLGCLA